MNGIVKKILDAYKDEGYSSFGEVLNNIQDLFEDVASKAEWREFLRKSNKDAEKTEGSDGMLINGVYFDWKEFHTRRNEIIIAFLGYFNDDQLSRIYKRLQGD